MKRLRLWFLMLVLIGAAGHGCADCDNDVSDADGTVAGDGQVGADGDAETLPPDFLPIIPGARGFGMDTVAGSGRHLDPPQTTVVTVTNLNDSGPGSLREALSEPGPRTVVFEVSGTIELQSVLGVPSHTTIAGQTAPSPGITLKGWELVTGSSDVLVQHLRVRVGDEPGGADYVERDALKTGGASHHVIIDHCSFSWSVDELADSRAAESTFRHCIFSEALHSPLHPEGPHSRGLLVHGYGPEESQRVSVIGCLFAHNMARNPSVLRNPRAVVANNLVYDVNVGPKCDDGGELQQTSVEGNVVLGSGNPMLARAQNVGSRFYFGPDNRIDGATFGSIAEVWAIVSMPFGVVPDGNRASGPPVVVPGLVLLPSDEVEDWVLANAGARPADRDAVDLRVVDDVVNGTGGVIASQSEVGGWPVLAENQRALTLPADPHGDDDGDGYTNLEEWLHEHAAAVEP